MSDTTPPSPAPVKKNRSIGKLILRLFVALVLLVLIGGAVLYFSRNTLVKMGVVRGGKYATGQDTGLIDADLSLVGGALSLENLDIANLPGYQEKNLLTMKKCDTTLDTGSIFSHTVTVKEIAIDGLEVWVEQKGVKNNLNDLMEAIKKNTPTASNTTSGATDAPGKELKIDTLRLTNTTIHLRSDFLNKDFTLDTIVMTDPTNPDGRPMKIADLVAKIMLKLSQQMLDDPNMPKEFKDGMKNVTALVGNLRGSLDKNVKVFSKSLQGLTTNPGQAIQDLGKNIPDMGKNLQNLNPFGNKPQTQPK